MNRCGRTSIKLNRYRAATRAQQLGASLRHETGVTALVTDADRLVGVQWRQIGRIGNCPRRGHRPGSRGLHHD
jgi:hypothetical protein